jgi:two-component system response regulator RegA
MHRFVAGIDPVSLCMTPSAYAPYATAFQRGTGEVDVQVSAGKTLSIKTLEWEHIHETLVETRFNISETARRLGLHRRTLARKLEKRRVK